MVDDFLPSFNVHSVHILKNLTKLHEYHTLTMLLVAILSLKKLSKSSLRSDDLLPNLFLDLSSVSGVLLVVS